MTGEGIIPSPAVTGKVTSSTTVVPLLGPPNVLIDNLPSTVTYSAEGRRLRFGADATTVWMEDKRDARKSWMGVTC